MIYECIKAIDASFRLSTLFPLNFLSRNQGVLPFVLFPPIPSRNQGVLPPEALGHVRAILEGLAMASRYPADSDCADGYSALPSSSPSGVAAAREEQSDVEEKRRVRGLFLGGDLPCMPNPASS